MTGEEVGVEVGLDDELDREVVLGRRVEVGRHVAARIDHDSTPRGGIADQVGRLRQAFQVVLFEDHPDLRAEATGERRARMAG